MTHIDQTSFDLLGKRWSALIIRDLIHGSRRFRELLHNLGKINDKVLSQRLKELEQLQIVDRKVFAEVPVRVEYSLTEKGRSLARVIGEMEQWDSAWATGPGLRGPAQEQPRLSPVGASPQLATSAAGGGPQATMTPPSPDRSQPSKTPFWKRLRL